MATIEHKCSICMDSFKNPILISCNHSFCYKCLEDYVRCNLRNGKFDCPLCRTSVELLKGDISDFQSISGYSDIDSVKNIACDLCGPRSVACGRCLDCEENLCQSCCHAHEKSKATKLHKICDLGTLDPDLKGKIRQRILCEKHNEEEIKLFCKSCKVVMCVLCKAVNHDLHATKTLPDAADEFHKKLETTLQQCTEKLRRLEVCSEMGNDVEKKINDSELEDIKAVEKQHSQLLILLDQEVGKMKDKIKSIYEELRKENEVFKEDVQKDTQTCTKANEDVKKLINQGTHIEKIQKGPDLERLITDVKRKSEKKPPRIDRKLFTPNMIKTSQLISMLGEVKDSTKFIPVCINSINLHHVLLL
ncbi:hypothetical protein ACJMK2_002354 [Sinanodonta woodiana]|uniref:Uncharacterized protein n=1 Tax=Sinanodonta woodiana TaxID=1069815 RepID=A0ABD3XV15_SINWO